MLGGAVAENFQAVATFDEALSGLDEAFELDGLDFGAVLFTLTATTDAT